jgi:putative endonuclease
MNARGQLGAGGEDVAAAHLTSLGYAVLERNYRCERGEIDIVAERDGVIVFCEVKTRRTDRWGAPSEAVNFHKQARLRRLAAHWLAERGVGQRSVRFDVISLVVRGRDHELQHLQDAF